MFADDSSKIDRIKSAMTALEQAQQKLQRHDYIAAQISVTYAGQVLEELQLSRWAQLNNGWNLGGGHIPYPGEKPQTP